MLSSLLSVEGFSIIQVTEELQLRERQLALRFSSIQDNLRLRSKVAMAMREYLVHNHSKKYSQLVVTPRSLFVTDFVEIETPTLFKRTSEVSLDFTEHSPCM